MSSRLPLPSTAPTAVAPGQHIDAAVEADIIQPSAAPAAPMPTVDAWAAEIAAVPLTTYLHGVDAALRQWIRVRDANDDAGRCAQVRAIRALSAGSAQLFKLPASEYDAIPEQVRWLILDIGRAAQAIEAANQSADAFRQPKHDVARADHLAGRTTLRRWLAAALEERGDRRLVNAAQWVRQGLLPLYLVTPTGDTAERALGAGMNSDSDGAFFPNPSSAAAWTLYEEVPARVYDPLNAGGGPDVFLQRNGLNSSGWQTPDALVVTQAALTRGQTYFWETLRHAAQIAAADGGDSPIARYGREYGARAFAGSAAFAALDNAVANIAVADPDDAGISYRFTARQHAIFKSIHAQCSHTSDSWRANPDVGGRTFRQAVAAFRDPDVEAINAWNSPRVARFYRRLEALPPGVATPGADLRRLLNASFGRRRTRLDVADARFLLTAPAARTRWEGSLSEKARRKMTTYLQRTVSGWKPWQLAICAFCGF